MKRLTELSEDERNMIEKTVDEQIELIKEFKLVKFFMSLKPRKKYPENINRCSKHITKLNQIGVIIHYLGGWYTVSPLGVLAQRKMRKELI